jgi:NTE family protein
MTGSARTSPRSRALVLGAGGHAAIAWEIGVIAGLADGGVDVRSADTFIGTSAGAVVASLITSGAPLSELFRRQAHPEAQAREPAPAVDLARWRSDLVALKARATGDAEFLRALHQLSPAATHDLDRRQIVEARLVSDTWPERDLLIVAVDVEQGVRHVFERGQNVSLVDAVAASGAVAGIWPEAVVAGRRYVDGGFFSIDNADLARGASRVLVLTLPARVPSICVVSLTDAVRALEQSGAVVKVVHPDSASDQAFASTGGNILDPAVRTPAALAGREQGRRLAPEVASFWAAPT